MRRFLPLAMALLALGFGPSEAAVDLCAPRLLLLSAFPGEIDMLLTQADVTDTVEIEGRRFFVGTLRGNEVVLALSGIGLVNAEETTTNAFAHFGCGGQTAITGVVFSGVSGGVDYIGDVSVPATWTMDGATPIDVDPVFDVDPVMFDTAKAASAGVRLTRRVPIGDLACVGVDPAIVRTIRMPKAPEIHFGGEGKSADSFNGRPWPCFPGGGDIFGCEPCRAPPTAPDVQKFVEDVRPFVDPDFFFGYFESPPPATTDYAAEDMETAAVAKVATAAGVPFIAFRSLSDGKGDPLHLPDFPAQFFFYRQLAADNAALVTLAFLEAWAGN